MVNPADKVVREVSSALSVIAHGLPHYVLPLYLELPRGEHLLKNIDYFFFGKTVGGLKHPYYLAKDDVVDEATLASGYCAPDIGGREGRLSLVISYEIPDKHISVKAPHRLFSPKPLFN